MKKTLLRLQTKPGLRNEVSQEKENFARSEKIALLFDGANQGQQDMASKLGEAIAKENKKVVAMMYVPSAKGSFENPSSYPFFSPDSFSFLGKIIDAKLNEFISEPFPFLFHLGLQRNPFVEYVLAASASKCRIGYYVKGMEQYFDFMLKVNMETEPLEWSKMLAYAKMIN
jgi:hypothetical protein